MELIHQMQPVESQEKHVTLITESVNHGPTLTLCHRLATTMPTPFPYLSVTVVLLTDGEETLTSQRCSKTIDSTRMPLSQWEGGEEVSCRCWKMINGSTVTQRISGSF